jgi:hypothetical protein
LQDGGAVRDRRTGPVCGSKLIEHRADRIGGQRASVAVDERPDWISEDRFAAVRRVGSWEEGFRAACERPGDSLACVMTCLHDTDFDLLRSLL